MANFLSMMQKAYSMKKTMDTLKKEIARLSVRGTSGNDLVSVEMRGDGSVISLSIDDSLIDMDSKPALVDCILFAFNDAQNTLETLKKEKMKAAMGDVPLDSLEGLL